MTVLDKYLYMHYYDSEVFILLGVMAKEAIAYATRMG